MTRRLKLCWAMLLGLVASWATFVQPVRAADRPNILLIYTDDHSHRTVSCYPEAFDWVHTPNIDRLAKQGVRFTHAYVGTWWWSFEVWR